MAEEKKKQEQDKKKGQNKNQKKADSFYVRELKERAEIKKQSQLFKRAVDNEKERQLQMIEQESKIRVNSMSNDISKLEDALKRDDPELIKEMLKNMQI